MITQSELKRLLKYNESTGEFVWLAYGRGQNYGKIAGSTSNGYVKIKIKGKEYKAHHLAWLYKYGYLTKQLDHINHIKNDNKIENLRKSTQKENTKNRSIPKTNTSGIIGVSWCRRSKKWLAQVMVDGRTKHLGYFADKFEAICARMSANNKYGFHGNHGR